MCEDLEYVDFGAIARAPAKWFMGYSDNTCLTYALPVLCDTAAVYGPCVSAFGASSLHESLYDAFDLLCGKNLKLHNYKAWESEEAGALADPLGGYAVDTPFEITAIDAGGIRLFGKDTPKDMVNHGAELCFEGRLLGGCIDVLSCLCGTRFDRTREFSKKYEKDGIIWFLEACDLDPMGIRRALWQLRNAGWFDTAKGFVFGRPFRYGAEAFGMDRIDAVVSSVGDMGVPVILDADIGHLPPMMPVISGAMAEVRAWEAGLSIEQRLI